MTGAIALWLLSNMDYLKLIPKLSILPRVLCYLKKEEALDGIARINHEINEQVSQLELTLAGARKEGFQKQPSSWEVKWDALKDTSKEIYKLTEIIELPYFTGDFKEKAEKYDEFYKNLEKLGKLVPPLELAIHDIDVRNDICEIQAVKAYASMLNKMFEKNRKTKIDIASYMTNFEDSNPNTRMSAYSRQKRHEIFPEKHNNKVTEYIGWVYNRMNECVPQYTTNPEGRFLGNKSCWKTKIDTEDLKAESKYKRFFSPIVEMNCAYLTKAPTPEEILERAETASKKGKHIVDCYVLENVSPELQHFVENFEHKNMSIYTYCTDRDELAYNDHSFSTEMFVGYFCDKKPHHSKQDILGLIENKGLVMKEDLQSKLKLTDKAITNLEKLNVLWSNCDGSYTLDKTNTGGV
jgi:hypothetical protein